MTSPAHPVAPPRGALLVVLLGAFVAVLDAFAVNVALPSLHTDLDAGPGELELVVAGYALAYASLLVTGGRLGDRYGRRRLFIVGMAGFTVASLACGLAPSAAWLVVFRLLQGATAALLFPQVFSLVQVLFTGPARVRALAAVSATMGLAAASGQLVGGALIQADLFGLGWRPIFLINLPVGIVAVLGARALVPESRQDDGRRLDIAGMVLGGLAVGLVVFPLAIGRSEGWPLWVWAMLAAAPLAAVAFVLRERRLDPERVAPVVLVELVRLRPFAGGLLVAACGYAGLYSFMFVLSLYTQVGLGMTPLESGLFFTPPATAYFLASLAAPRLAGARPLRLLALAGTATVAARLLAALLAWNGGSDVSRPLLLVVATVHGAALALFLAPMFGVVLGSVPARAAGASSGILSTVQQAGGSIGVSAVGALFFGLAATPADIPDAFAVGVVASALLALGATAALLLVSARPALRLAPQEQPEAQHAG